MNPFQGLGRAATATAFGGAGRKRGRRRAARDYLVYETLAEKKIALAQLERLERPDVGFNERLEERFRVAPPHCRRRATRVITLDGESVSADAYLDAARMVAALMQRAGTHGKYCSPLILTLPIVMPAPRAARLQLKDRRPLAGGARPAESRRD